MVGCGIGDAKYSHPSKLHALLSALTDPHTALYCARSPILRAIILTISYEPKFPSYPSSKGTIRFAARTHDSIVAHLYMLVKVNYNESSQLLNFTTWDYRNSMRRTTIELALMRAKRKIFSACCNLQAACQCPIFPILLPIAIQFSHAGSLAVFQSFMSMMIRNQLSINAFPECRCLVWCLFCHSQWATTISWMPLCTSCLVYKTTCVSLRSLNRLGYVQEPSKMSGKTVKLYELCMKDDNRVSLGILGLMAHGAQSVCSWTCIISLSRFWSRRQFPALSLSTELCPQSHRITGDAVQARLVIIKLDLVLKYEPLVSIMCMFWMLACCTNDILCFAALFSLLLESKVCLSPQGLFSSSQLLNY